MIYPDHVEMVPACSTLEAGQLVLCQANVSSFGITCRLQNEPRVVLLADDAVPGKRGPAITTFDSNCVTFGHRYVVGYDANHLSPNGTPKLGDLVIRGVGLNLVALAESEPCLVNFATGEVGAVAPGMVVRMWSISVDTWMNGKFVEIHWHGQ